MEFRPYKLRQLPIHMPPSWNSDPPKVYLVGAGPGEPGSITLRALECLAAADAVVYDYLVNPSLLRWATKPSVQLFPLGGHGSPEGRDQDLLGSASNARRIMSQDEVNELVVRLAQQGLKVVRLKCGDPLIFARAAEEITALQEAQIRYEIVPGITSALAAGSYAGIPLTHRDHASAVALVTGHPAAEKISQGETIAPARRSDLANNESPKSPHAPLDWAALAKFPGTLIVYMGTTQMEFWVGELLRHGKPSETPVAILRRCGFSDQTVKRTTLGQLVEVATNPKRIRPPVVFVIGTAVSAALGFDWFAQRPLRGQTILVTRPSTEANPVLRDLELMGAQVLHWPAISILPLEDFVDLDSVLCSLEQYRWIVFNSSNGVRAFFDRLWAIGRDARVLANCRLAAVGRQTAQAMAERHLKCDLLPSKFDAEHLATALLAEIGDGTCLNVRASRGRNVFAERMQAAGVSCRQVVAYRNVDTAAVPSEIQSAVANGKVDWVTVTSNAIADNLSRCFGAQLRKTKLASISPLTSERLRELGLQVAVEAQDATFDGLIQAILTASTSATGAATTPRIS
ncbi:MAG: bifunctional uroporphyrinogen-III C-methylase/synthase [Planctomycetaceae bacterium]|nr:bifunctional uroporphyrinogen-III C-methylase/synthase [Planctomycetaceae bacterium]